MQIISQQMPRNSNLAASVVPPSEFPFSKVLFVFLGHSHIVWCGMVWNGAVTAATFSQAQTNLSQQTSNLLTQVLVHVEIKQTNKQT